jgi:hypothetical protein
MDNTYIVYSDDIIDVMTQIENFQASMIRFIQKHPQYRYDIDIKERDKDPKWRIEIKVQTDEESINNTTP